MALVERYMIDAEEAEARAKSAPENVVRLSQREHEAVKRVAEEPAQRHAEELRTAVERTRREGNGFVRRETVTGLDVDEVDDPPVRTTARQEARTPKELAKAERRAAKHAARVVAVMEKKEARERKALAKAAAKREAQARKALTKSA